MERSRTKKQQDLRDLQRQKVLTGESEPGQAGLLSGEEEHLTLAEAERFRTCRLNEAGAMDFIRAVNSHLMLCPACRALVQANDDLGEALDEAEEERR